MRAAQNILAIVVLFLSAGACRTSEPKPSEEKLTKKDPVSTDTLQLVHPEKADAWFTHKIVADNTQPKKGAIAECDLHVTVFSSNARNDQDLLDAKLQLGKETIQDVAIYHWCFYQAVRVLDQNLADSQKTFEWKSEEFFQTMKALWLLAKALELATNDEHYFVYLRERYVQLNRDIFGRHVTSMVPPIDERLQTPKTRFQESRYKDEDDLEFD